MSSGLTLEELEATKSKLDESAAKYGGKIWLSQQGGTEVIGEILNTDPEISPELVKLGLPLTDTVDVISTNMLSGEVKKYYIRFGTLLDYMKSSIIPKILPKEHSYLEVDTEVKNNIMYTIPNQISTNPEI